MEPTYIPINELEQFAADWAPEITGALGLRHARRETRRAIKTLRAAEAGFRRGGEGALSPAGRWLLDNLYLAEQAAGAVRAALRQPGKLRATREGLLIAAVAERLLAAGGGETDEERIEAFLSGLQRRTVLTPRELSLLPVCLRRAALLSLGQLYAAGESDGARCGVLFNTLRRLSTLELGDVLERADRVDALLRADPAGVYPLMDETTRYSYRRRTALLARREGVSAHEMAERLLSLAEGGRTERARHVGYYLFERPLGKAPRQRRGGGYIAVNAALTLFLSVLLGCLVHSRWAAVLALLSFSQLIKEAVDAYLLAVTPPAQLPRLELKEGVPLRGRTICVISVLLTGEQAADRAARRLEEFYMGSRDCGENLLFGLLCDLPESREILTAEDNRLLTYAGERINTLCRRHGDRFVLLSRERIWNHASGRFSPWERKRGATLELCRLLAGEPSSLGVTAGAGQALYDVRYILTLDSDTVLPPESARAMLGTALHPLNTPVTDLRRGVVVRGHGVLQPRMAVELQSAYKTDFARIFAPQGGGDPYGSNAGEVYMDRFRSGGFAGKGLIHVQAYLDCAGRRFPEGQILSHDALEGAYLRGGYVNDVEFTDGFPVTASAWFQRQHRWVRGDWQNLPWLGRAGRDLPVIERWRLFDSLRRSLLPAAQLAGLAAPLLFPGEAAAAAGITAAAALLSPALSAAFRALFRSAEDARLRVHSALLHGVAAHLLRSLTKLWLLPHEAWVGLSAAACALWRMKVSHKNLLQWRTAEQSEASARSGLGAYYKEMWFCVVFGCVLLTAGRGIPGLAAGIAWLFAPVLAFSLGREKKTREPLTAGDRGWLLRRGAEIWRYFQEYCAPEDHFLPPDNVQLSPAAEIARRVSPTNLGLGLLSAVCALELGLAGEREAMGLCENLLSAAERLPKWRGHLYNWYDSRSMTPLSPAYVSTVDSGNLCGCLIAAAGALSERGAPTLAARARALAREMDFRALYDEKRHLFYIGVDGEGVPSRSWYDLMESEERLTGYIAIASRQVPIKHWRRLSRAQVGRDGYHGMVSWTGTAFEYLMPELFLPLYKNSHLYESARFALYVQRKRAAGQDKLWGISESAFAALDSTFHYRYKAHGCPALALCRGLEKELVISPYSSYLALSVSPRAAMANLRRMERDEYMGPYGLWEAIDFTPGRGALPLGTPVRCVMAHHLGMSLAAITNALCQGAVRRWFLAEPAMAAYTTLLQEKVPLGDKLLRRRGEMAPPRKRAAAPDAMRRTGQGVDFLHPQAAALSNGGYSLLFSESGVSRSRCGALTLYRSPRAADEDAHGMELFLRQDGETVSLLPRPGQAAAYSWEFTAGEAVLRGQWQDMRWTLSAGVSTGHSGEWRRLTLRRAHGTAEGELYLSFEPVLLPDKDYRAHPSFARLGLFTQARDGVLSVRRLARGGQGEQYLALACTREAEFSSDFQRFPGRGGGEAFFPNTGWQSECRAAARVLLPAGEETWSVGFGLCVAGEEDAAVRGAQSILREPGGFAMAALLSERLGMDTGEPEEAMALLSALFWPQAAPQGAAVPAARREALWKLGISGDVPIHAVECRAGQSVAAAQREARRHALLTQCGMRYDLVFLTSDEGDYRRACRAALEEAMERLDMGGTLGEKGGVHFASLEQDRETLMGAAAVWSGPDGCALPERQTGLSPRWPDAARVPQTAPAWRFDGLAFSFVNRRSLPGRSWGCPLYGGGLGYFAADAGIGSLWWKNARECPVTPWAGDPLLTAGPERLWAEINGRPVSFFASPEDEDGAVIYDLGAAVWKKTVDGVALCLTAFIPPETPVRVFLLESSQSVEVRWCAPVQLAPEPEDAIGCYVNLSGDALRAENPRCPFAGTVVTARCSAPWTERSGDADAFLFSQASTSPRGGRGALAGRFTLSGEAVLLCGTADAPDLLDTARAREALAATRRHWREKLCRLECRGADGVLLPLMNGWSAYQAMVCREKGRSSLYQSGGAVGFRDQLQDYVNLLWLDAPGCRAHILTCCAHQFTQGDVQHWWHPGDGETDKGVRTRCADDLLWLPWAVCEYAEATGDQALCRETAPYLASAPLSPEETSRYELPALSGETGSVADHCRRAVRLVLGRGLGAHRLLLMGSGDWNDGFDAMGEGAESVWLTWFASIVCQRFSALLRALGEDGAEKYEAVARALGGAANEAWDGDHYLRGYYSNGEPLGGAGSAACQIDSVAQSFAVFCPWADRERAKTALRTALERLWDRGNHRIALYAPPFGPGQRAPGYVGTYGPGFRENGGQYTHAAVWLARACFAAGMPQEGEALLRDIALAARQEEYLAEPFALAADVYTAPGAEGRAGWSWYTGAAGWWYRAAWEDLMGFSLRDGRARLSADAPGMQKGWRAFFDGAELAPATPGKEANNS